MVVPNGANMRCNCAALNQADDRLGIKDGDEGTVRANKSIFMTIKLIAVRRLMGHLTSPFTGPHYWIVAHLAHYFLEAGTPFPLRLPLTSSLNFSFSHSVLI